MCCSSVTRTYIIITCFITTVLHVVEVKIATVYILFLYNNGYQSIIGSDILLQIQERFEVLLKLLKEMISDETNLNT